MNLERVVATTTYREVASQVYGTLRCASAERKHTAVKRPSVPYNTLLRLQRPKTSQNDRSS